DDVARLDRRLPILAAAGEQEGEQRLENGEALGRHRAGGSLAVAVSRSRRELARELRRLSSVRLVNRAERSGHLASELRRLERHGSAVLPEDPRHEQRQGRVLGHEHVVLEASRVAVRALDPPGGVAGHLDAGLADDVADLPRRPPAVLVDVEVARNLEIALAAGRET